MHAAERVPAGQQPALSRAMVMSLQKRPSVDVDTAKAFCKADDEAFAERAEEHRR